MRGGHNRTDTHTHRKHTTHQTHTTQRNTCHRPQSPHTTQHTTQVTQHAHALTAPRHNTKTQHSTASQQYPCATREARNVVGAVSAEFLHDPSVVAEAHDYGGDAGEIRLHPELVELGSVCTGERRRCGRLHTRHTTHTDCHTTTPSRTNTKRHTQRG